MSITINTDLFSIRIIEKDDSIRVGHKAYKRDGTRDRWHWIEDQDALVDAARLVGMVETLRKYWK